MRTTLDLPDDLLKEAKAASALRGISLKTYVTEALRRYRGVGSAAGSRGESQRAQLPLIGRSDGPLQRPSGQAIEDALAESENLRLRP